MENNLESVSKSFFSKPEGKVGKVFLWLMGIAGAIGLYKALPYIIVLLTNTLHAMFLLGAIVLLIFLVTNKKIKTLFSFGFKMLMRYITGIFVELNPIAIIRIHIENLENNHELMNTHIMRLSGEVRSLERKIKDNKGEIENSLKIASSAKEQNSKGQAWLQARKAGRRKDGTIKLSDLLNKIKKIHSVLTKMYEVSGFVIEDLKDEVEIKETEYKSIKQAHAAMMASMSIINGNPNERAMFELALEKMEEEVSQKLGTMDRFMDMSSSLVQSINIEQGVFAEDGMRMLEEYEQGGFDAFFNDFGGTNPEEVKVLTNSNIDNSFNGVKTLERDAVTGKYF
jgi:hypothetical protein